MIWVDHIAGRYYLTLGGSMSSYLDSGRTPTVGQWEHIAATYDGSVARFYVGGVEVASRRPPPASAARTPGGWAPTAARPTGFFDGLIDNVRVYDRALSAERDPDEHGVRDPARDDSADRDREDSGRRLERSQRRQPGNGDVQRADEGEHRSRRRRSSSRTRRTRSSPRPSRYNATTQKATLTPQSALAYGATYTATVKGGAGGVTDVAGNALAASVVWSFTTEASPPQLLVVTSTARPFGSYLGEILRNEGLNAFTTIDVSFLSPALLSGFDVVVLGETPLSPAQVSTLTGWVNGGGNLIAMRPDKQLAGLLGLTYAERRRARTPT